MAERASALALLIALLVSGLAVGQELSPRDVVTSTLQSSPRMTELGLTVKEATLDARAQDSIRPWTLRASAGGQFDEQPSVDVIQSGVRKTTTYLSSVELLKQLVIGTAFTLRFDIARTVAEVPFTVDELNIREIRKIGPNWTASARLQATQPLLKGRSPRANDISATLAQKQVDITELQRRQVAISLMSEALDAYWRWVGAELTVAATSDSLARTKQLSDATVAQIEAGQLAELERDIVAQRMAAAEQTVVTAQSAAMDANENLRKVMGASLGDTKRHSPLVEVPADPPEIPEVQVALDAAIRASPDVALLQEQVDAARLAIVRSEDQTRPQLDVVANVAQLGLAEDLGTAFEQVGTLDFTSLYLGLSFAMPLDNGLARRTLESDEVAVMVAQARRDEAMREIELRVRQARRLLQTQKRRLELSATEIELARKNLGAMQAKFEAGLASYLEVLQLEEDLSGAQQRFNEARIDALTARVALQRVTGTLLDDWGLELD
jgi:outer membrane protein TolC